MAINKKLIHFESFVNFNSQKLSANKENNTYTIGVYGEVESGIPDILYQSIVYIKDTKQQWTHGQLYNETITKDKLIDLGVNLTSVDIDEEVVESPEMEYATVGYVDQALAELDSVAELMQEVTYKELVTMRNHSKLIPGMKYRMIDYETVLPANDTWHSVAGHHFDLILTALDEKTLSERCSAIQSARDTEGYFANNNLGAWEIHYCLDNDTSRFGWAVGTRPAIRVDLSPIGMSAITVPYSGGFVDKDIYYCRWDATIEGENVSFLTFGDATGNIIEYSNTLYVLASYYINGSLAGTAIEEFGTVDDVTFITDERGKGVIYRMIDEYQNDVYYDFKNVIVAKKHLLAGLDLYDGYTFTMAVGEEGNIIKDASNCGMCRNNLIKSSHGLLFNCIASLEEGSMYVSDIQLGSNCFLCFLVGTNITIGDYCTNIQMMLANHISIGNVCSNINIYFDGNLSIVNQVSGTFDNPVAIGFTSLVPCAKKIAQNNNGQVVMFMEGEFTEPEVLWPAVDEE